MQINTNAWNRIRYTLFTPIYDLIGRIFTKSRLLSIKRLQIKADEKVLLVGAGTGLDLELIQSASQITAIDITPSMVAAIRKRSKTLNLKVEAQVMDGHHLLFEDSSFDKIILHLIVAVIPNPVLCLREAERVLRAGGKIAVYDKFLAHGKRITLKRKWLNYLTNTFFSNINRDFESILDKTNLKIVSDEAADFGGNFRIIILTK